MSEKTAGAPGSPALSFPPELLERLNRCAFLIAYYGAKGDEDKAAFWRDELRQAAGEAGLELDDEQIATMAREQWLASISAHRHAVAEQADEAERMGPEQRRASGVPDPATLRRHLARVDYSLGSEPRTGPRPRGAGRPRARRVARASTRSGDSGDDGPEPPGAARGARRLSSREEIEEWAHERYETLKALYESEGAP
jgi:hypothetical protein